MIQDTDAQPECLDSAGYGSNECAGPLALPLSLSVLLELQSRTEEEP